MCPWGISTQQSPPGLALCCSPLAFSGYCGLSLNQADESGRRQVTSGLWPEGPDPCADKEWTGTVIQTVSEEKQGSTAEPWARLLFLISI